jgi:trigger factor
VSQTTDLPQVAVEIEHKPHCAVVVQVEVPANLVDGEFEKAIKAINKEVSLPGYRKGHAPRDYMLKHFKTSIEHRWKDELAQLALDKMLRQTSLYPLDPNSKVHCEWKSCQLGQASACTFSYEVMPKVPEIVTAELKAEKPTQPEASEEALEKELEELAKRNSHWNDVHSETPAIGQWVELEVKDAEGQPVFIGKKFELTKHTMPSELFEAVQGLKTGESKTALLKRPGSDEKVEATILLKSVSERVQANVDDALAKHLGLQDLNALKERIRRNLNESLQSDFRNACFEAIQKSLSSQYHFEVPQSTLGYEKQMHENSLAHEMGKNVDDMSAEEKEDLKKRAHERAEAAIRQTFLLHKIAAQENIRIEDPEVHEMMRPFLYELQKEKDQNRLRARFQTLYSRCRMHLLTEKALEHLAKHLGWL